MAAVISSKCPICRMNVPGFGDDLIFRHIKESHPNIQLIPTSPKIVENRNASSELTSAVEPVCRVADNSTVGSRDTNDSNARASTAGRSAVESWEADHECPVCFLDFESVKALNDHIDIHWDEEETTRTQLVQDTNAENIYSRPSVLRQNSNIRPKAKSVENRNARSELASAVKADHMDRGGSSVDLWDNDSNVGRRDTRDSIVESSDAYGSAVGDIAVERRHTQRMDVEARDKEERRVNPVCKKKKSDHTNPEEKIQIPGLNDIIMYEDEPIEFEILLMKLCVQSGRENVYESLLASRYGNPIPPWNNSHAIELLEKHYPQALKWSRNTLMERLTEAEANAWKCKMTKEEVFRKSTKRPYNEKDNYMAEMVNELDEIRDTLTDINRARDKEEKSKTKKNTKSEEKESGSESDDDEFSEKMAQDKIKKGTLVGRSKDKASEADEMRRRSVQAIANGYSVKKDDDQELDNVSGIDKLINVVTVLATKELEGGNAASNEKLKAVEEKQEKLENQMEKNKVEMEQKMEENKKEVQDKLDHNQMESNTRFDELKEAVDKGSQKQDNVLDKLTQFINSQSKKDKDSKND